MTQRYKPETIKALDAQTMLDIYEANAVIPSLIAKHFIPKLPHQTYNTFAALSARVGSITDNQLGGWYSYRAAKAALNMLIKTASIEAKLFHKNSIVVGLHPGTVDSFLSKPFQKNVKADKLFTPQFAANALIDVIAGLNIADSGQCLAWDGEHIEPKKHYQCIRMILGDQLTDTISSLKQCNKQQDLIFMCEVKTEATTIKHHKKKIAFIFSAMRHFALRLKQQGYSVHYINLDDQYNTQSFTSELVRLLTQTSCDHIVATEPSEYRVLSSLEQ